MLNSNALKTARLNAGLTQEQAAEQAKVGRSTIHRGENGHPLTVKNLCKLASIYNVDVVTLLSLTEVD